jgi:predicted metal-dependent phosphoesterase TrpH
VSVDLHSHTTASDGAHAPAELVALAAGAGVTTLAVTDHDTFAGLPEAIAEGEQRGVRVLVGVEISVRHRPGTFHLLAYFPGLESTPLHKRLEEMRLRREERARSILARLEALGAPVEWSAVTSRARGAIGRPHVADALVAAGHVPDRQAAFDRFLADDAPAFEPSRGLAPDEAIALVRESGGAAVLAHPFSLRLRRRELGATIHRLKQRGLAGIEVHRGDHTPDQYRALGKLARGLDLIPCGGSDFHRAGDDRRLGNTGLPPVPAEVPEILLEHCERNDPART